MRTISGLGRFVKLWSVWLILTGFYLVTQFLPLGDILKSFNAALGFFVPIGFWNAAAIQGIIEDDLLQCSSCTVSAIGKLIFIILIISFLIFGERLFFKVLFKDKIRGFLKFVVILVILLAATYLMDLVISGSWKSLEYFQGQVI